VGASLTETRTLFHFRCEKRALKKRSLYIILFSMISHILIFAVAFLLVIRGATLATKYAASFAESLRLSTYAVGFIIIAIISILPETFIAINAALTGIPEFGLGMLLGSNVADLTLIFALVVLFSGRHIAVEQKILKNHVLYPLILLLPIVLGLDGHFSRVEGIALILAGLIFYYLALRNEKRIERTAHTTKVKYKSLILLLLSLAVLLLGAHFTVSSASDIASSLGVSPVLIAMLIVGLGTTMPELFFSLKSMRDKNDSLAVGDILGTVLANATIVIGILAIINPFAFPTKMIYIGGIFMVAASVILFSFMRSGRKLTSMEAYALIIFWLTFVMVELIVNA